MNAGSIGQEINPKKERYFENTDDLMRAILERNDPQFFISK